MQNADACRDPWCAEGLEMMMCVGDRDYDVAAAAQLPIELAHHVIAADEDPDFADEFREWSEYVVEGDGCLMLAIEQSCDEGMLLPWDMRRSADNAPTRQALGPARIPRRLPAARAGPHRPSGLLGGPLRAGPAPWVPGLVTGDAAAAGSGRERVGVQADEDLAETSLAVNRPSAARGRAGDRTDLIPLPRALAA